MRSFETDYIEIFRHLYKIENLRLASIPDKYIIQIMLENDSLIIKALEKLDEKELIMDIIEKLKG